VGLLIGTVGVGGVLMVSFLALIGGMSGALTIHQAAATSLFSFLFTGLVGPRSTSAAAASTGASRFRCAPPHCSSASAVPPSPRSSIRGLWPSSSRS
jgi:hypothetical protein